MIETLLGTVLGGAFRLAPEVLKWMDKDKDRQHELAMFDRQLELDKMRSEAELDKINAQAAAAFSVADIQALMEVSKAQAQPTGNKRVDALNALVRPLLTFWHAVILYTAILWCKFMYLTTTEGVSAVDAVVSLGQDHSAIVAAIMSFWFMDRSLVKGPLK